MNSLRSPGRDLDVTDLRDLVPASVEAYIREHALYSLRD